MSSHQTRKFQAGGLQRSEDQPRRHATGLLSASSNGLTWSQLNYNLTFVIDDLKFTTTYHFLIDMASNTC